MISAQTRFRVFREEKPVSTFSDHALREKPRLDNGWLRSCHRPQKLPSARLP